MINKSIVNICKHWICLALLLPGNALCQDSIFVDSLQPPAWINKPGGKIALQPGMTVNPEEKIYTGNLGKVVLQMPEGSKVKLGESTDFTVEQAEDLETPQDETFKGILRILTGAFRFTTEKLAAQKKRNIDIRLATATIGIRGTDLWGRSNKNREFICLIEGQISITRDNEPQVTMTNSRSTYTVEKNKPANPLGVISAAQLAELATETELDYGNGVLTQDGKYTVYLLSTQNRQYAEKIQQEIQQRGYPANITSVTVNQKLWNRIGIQNFATLEDARSFSANTQNSLGIKNNWINKE